MNHSTCWKAVAYFATFLPTLASADPEYFAAIGFTQLRQELGDALPDGTGVLVSQIEADPGSPAGEPNPITYYPNPDNAALQDINFIYPWADINGNPGGDGDSGHATTVARFFYGRNDTAPGIREAICYYVNRWLGIDYIFYNSSVPPVSDGARVHNHSWIGTLESDSADIESLQRYDLAIVRDNVLAVAGSSNGSNSSIRNLMAKGHNVLAVGRGDGGHGSGLVDFDGPNRTVPQIVVPEASVTSTAAPIVSASGAILISHALANPGLSLIPGHAEQQESIRAILLAGAVKTGLNGSWSQTETEPLDDKFGVGALNIRNSYYILDAGETTPWMGNPQQIAPHLAAWDRGQVNAGGTTGYLLHIPDGQVLRNFSPVLVWNRTFSNSNPEQWQDITPVLANLSLVIRDVVQGIPGEELLRSDAPGGVVEHIFTDLLPGTYLLEVQNPSAASVTYAIAWRGDLGPISYLEMAQLLIAENPGVQDLPPDGDYDKDGNLNLLEFATCTNLLVPDAEQGPEITVVAGSAMHTLDVTVTFRRRPFEAPVSYIIEKTNDFVMYSDCTAEFTVEYGEPDAMGCFEVTYSAEIEIRDAFRTFFRLTVDDTSSQ